MLHRRQEHSGAHGTLPGSAWSMETLDLHLDLSVARVRELLDQYRDAHAEVHAIQDKQLDRTAEGLTRRLEDMNNWREQLREQAGQFVTLAEFHAHVNGQAQRLQDGIAGLNQDMIRLTSLGQQNAAHIEGVERRTEIAEKRLNEQLPREVYEQQHTSLTNRVEIIEKWRATLGGRTTAIMALIGLMSGTFGVIIGHVVFKG